MPTIRRFLVICLFFVSQSFAQQKAVHSHNDYAQTVPFWMAFSAGCASIEADIFLDNGQLVVAHSLAEMDAQKTLNALYLEPISVLIKQEGLSNRKLQLLIDIKSEANATLEKLIVELQKYPNIIAQESPIRIIISGNRPTEYRNYPNFILFDHQELGNLSSVSLEKVALVSFSFRKFSFWNGVGDLPLADKTQLIKVIEQVHSVGKPIRFWATPDTPAAWQILAELQVDFINTDQPFRCRNFLNKPN